MFAKNYDGLWERVLFVFAHMDDETISSYGTIQRLRFEHAAVKVVCLCGNGRLGADPEKQRSRAQIFESLGNDGLAVERRPFNDLGLTRETAQAEFDAAVAAYRPDVVVTHWPHDLHFEHRLVGEAALVSCRRAPGCTVRQLLFTSSPAERWTFGGQGEQFRPNFFVETGYCAEAKLAALREYEKCGELPSARGDLRSPDSVMEYDSFNGRVAGTGPAEAYVKVFEVAGCRY